MKHPYMPDMAYMIRKTEDGYYYLSDNFGFIMDCEDMIEISCWLFEFADNFEDYVREHNERRYKEYEEMLHGYKEDAKQPKPKAKYYVYMMQCEDKYKIGISKDVERRRKELDNRPFPVKIVCTSRLIEGGYDIEQELHKELAQYRVGGEWYDFNEDVARELQDFISNL